MFKSLKDGMEKYIQMEKSPVNRLVIWFVLLQITISLFGMFARTTAGTILFACLGGYSFYRMVVKPMIMEKEKNSGTQTEDHKEPEAQAPQSSSEEKKSDFEESIIDMQKQIAHDIDLCLYNSGFDWQWASSSSFTQISMTWHHDGRKYYYDGTIMVKGGRAAAVFVVDDNGQTVRFKRDIATSDDPKPVQHVTTETQEKEDERATVDSTPTPNDDVEITDISKEESIIKNRKSIPPEEEMPLAEETQEYLLTSTDIPPVDEAVLRQSVQLIADAEAMSLNDLAVAADEAGESSFAFHWPEGIQTKMEAEMFASLIVTRVDFDSAKISADNQIIVFYLRENENF